MAEPQLSAPGLGVGPPPLAMGSGLLPNACVEKLHMAASHRGEWAMYLGGPPTLKLTFCSIPLIPEPIPQPQIQIHVASSASGWCNISLECWTPGATEDLEVTWLSTGLPRELEQRETLGPAPNSRNLTLSWLLSQSVGSLTCMVCNLWTGRMQLYSWRTSVHGGVSVIC